MVGSHHRNLEVIWKNSLSLSSVAYRATASKFCAKFPQNESMLRPPCPSESMRTQQDNVWKLPSERVDVLTRFLTRDGRETGRTQRSQDEEEEEPYTMKTKTSTLKHEEVPDLLVMRADAVWTSCEQHWSVHSRVYTSSLLLFYRLRPSPGCSHMFLLVCRTRQPAAAASQTLTTQHEHTTFHTVHVWKHIFSLLLFVSSCSFIVTVFALILFSHSFYLEVLTVLFTFLLFPVPLSSSCSSLSLPEVQQQLTLFLRLQTLVFVSVMSSGRRPGPAESIQLNMVLISWLLVRLIYLSWNLNSLWSEYLTCKIT